MQTIITTQIQSLDAAELLIRFDKLQKGLEDLKEKVTPKEATVLMTCKEVAKLLGVSLPTLYDWTKKGILQSYRIGNRKKYKQNEVLNALQIISHK